MKKVLLTLIILSCINNFVYAETVQLPTHTVNPATVVQNVPFEICTKMFSNISAEKLFYKTISAINSNNFEINEIQTFDGYIIFTVSQHKYLATIAEIDKNNSLLKITPCNNIYFFQPGIVTNVFKYIELSMQNKV